MKTLNPWKHRNAGFTLIEVMFALTLVGISLTVLLSSQSQSLRLASEAKFNTTAAFLAQGKMAEIESMELKDLAPDSGDFGELFPDYHWELRVDNTSLPILDEYEDRFKKLDLYIYWGENRTYEYSLRLYKFLS